MVTCRVAGTKITHDLRLAVTAPPSPLMVRLSRSSLGTSLVCSADRIAPELRLCWFKKGRKIKCQEAGAVSVATSAAGPRLTCRPQLKVGKASLSSVAEQGYMRMALAVERVVQLAQTETDLGMQLLHNCHRGTNCQSCAKLRANNCYWHQGLNLCGHSDSSADAGVAELDGFKCPVEGEADLLKMRRWGPETEQVADDLNQGHSSEVDPVPGRYTEVTEVTKSVTVFAVAIALTIGFACGVVLLHLIRVCYNRKLARSKSTTKHLDERLKQRTVMEKESCKKAEENVYSTKEELMKDCRSPQNG